MAIDCVLIGDTIALNLQSSMKCAEVRAAPNYTSSRVINLANGGKDAFHEVCIISAGSYDYYGSLKTIKNLGQIRDKAVCKVYVWIKPIANNPTAQNAVDAISEDKGDIEVEITKSNDGVTPSSYGDLAASIVNQLNAQGL